MNSNEKINKLKADFNGISNKYRKENINSNTVVSKDGEVLSYISSRMGETSAIIDAVFEKLSKVASFENSVNTVLDMGSGTGSTLWALDNYVKNAKVFAVEREKAMIKYSKILSGDLSSNVTYIDEDVLSQAVKKLENVDMVVEAFMLNEMADSDRLKALEIMCDKTNKFLVLIEPGTPKSYERMMELRSFALEKGLNLILPCPHSEKCGLSDDYCNFSVRVSRTKTSRQVKGGTLNYEDEKYFYLVFAKESLEKTYNSTVLRRPVYRKGCVDLKLCRQDSTIKSITITKSNKDNYKKAKDYSHGDNINLYC